MSDTPKGATESIAISKFKATCLAVIDRVKRTGQPVLITRFGEPMAQLVPPPPEPRPPRWLGSLRDRGSTVGDIVAPASSPDEWEVLRSSPAEQGFEETP